ncbi:Crp/Fnr family transcriptional regulator [Gimesia aquarii]|uniref:Global nitrogen regulator n=1 Tax=Gimesia aquarii TaxID=2527964 RepID=A0A517W4W3_9PLAN|nr:Crp/Fnr family transcriptional regulator [Gimesia aquarii]QDU00284.1 Global nitrogen regulator [Gimesia aquarii]
MDKNFWYLKNCDLFERLSQDQIADVERHSSVRQFGRGNLVYLPTESSDSVFLVLTGRVKLYHITGEGKQALLALIEPGELFGELAILGGGEREEYAEAMLKSTIIRIPGQVIQDLMEQHAGVSLGVTKLMGLRRQRVEQRLKSLLFRSNRDRLTHLLLDLAEKYGRFTPQGVLINIKLSHQELASIIGSTRETVTVLLGEMQDERTIDVQKRQIILRKAQHLAHSIDFKLTPALLTKPDQSGEHLLRGAEA